MTSPIRRVTMADVAEYAGVTKTTVSRVLNNKGEYGEETRARVLQAVETLGYRRSRIARSLAMDRTFLLGLIVPSIASEFFSEIVRGAEDTAWENDYKIILCTTESDLDREADMFQFLNDIQVDGILVSSPRLPEDRLLPLIDQFQNVVVINGQGISWHELAGAIEINEIDGMAQAVTHLLDNGRHKLAYLGGCPDSRSSDERRKGFIQALESAGLTPHQHALHTVSVAHIEGGYACMKHTMEVYPDVDGIICFNDLMAVGAIQACLEMGRKVPGDIAFIGNDNIQLADLFSPGLTTLHTPKKEIGALAVQMLLERIEGKQNQETVVINQQLIIRESTP